MNHTKIIYFLMGFLIFTAGCDQGSNKSNKGTPSQNPAYKTEDLGYNPYKRWSETGSYSYDFDFTFNGSHCSTKKSFNNKADYCLGLQDQALNHSCAVSIRKQTYERDCGNDFQELNFNNP